MKPIVKRIAALTLLIAAAAAADAWTKTGLVLDPAVPKAQTALVTFGEGVFPRQVNGINIRKAWYGGDEKWSNVAVEARIPEGTMQLEFDLAVIFGSAYHQSKYQGKNFKTELDIEAGKKYLLTVESARVVRDETSVRIISIVWYDTTGRSKVMLKSWELQS
jgi:hypothetical protein